MGRVFSRYGDSYAAWFTEEEIRRDLEAGTKDAAERGKISELTQEDVDRLFNICTMPEKVVCVERGHEVVVSFDAGTLKLPVRAGIPLDRSQAILTHEKALCSDTMELAHVDYSFKQCKSILSEEKITMQHAQLNTIIPLFYGAMPNLGLYTKPDGPVDNWSELLPMGKIAEARAAQDEAVEHAVKDMVFVASGMYEAGADGINFDTVGASGDADVLASLKAVEILKNKYPEMAIEFGMAGEFILGMHGQLSYNGTRLAGLYPHQQVKIAEEAGVTIFGATVNTNSSKSFPWNIARVCTFIKACTAVAKIPVHVDVGMGVGAIPLSNVPPVDAVTRADKALIEVGKADGL